MTAPNASSNHPAPEAQVMLYALMDHLERLAPQTLLRVVD